MKKFYTLVILTGLFFLNSTISIGQTLYDSFTDANFTASPVWGGNTTNWAIVANSDVAAGATGSSTVRLAAPALAQTDYLSSQISTWQSAQEWGFFIGRRGQAFTAANQMYIWLYANEATLTSGTVDGYRIAIGDDVTTDEIRLEYIVNGALSATVIASSGAITNAITDIGFLLRVTRSNSGVWEIFTSTLPTANGTGAIASDIPNAANASISQGTATHNTIVPAANGYIGVAAIHTAGAAAIITVEFDQVYFTCSTPASIAVPTNFTVSSPYCVTNVTGVSFNLDFTSTGTYTGNTYYVELSDNTGAFGSPTTIGSIADNTNAVTNLSCTIPAATVSGTLYKIRVRSSSPAVIGTATGNLIINLASNSISPGGVQTTCPATNGTTLTVNEGSTPTSRQWQSSITSGSGYGNISGATNSTYTPNFATPGDYYIICNSVFSCATQTSNEVHVIVTVSNVTGLTATTSNGEIDLNWTNPICYDEILIVATNGGAVVSAPTGDGTQYFDNPIYGDALSNANLAANEFDVFQGTNPSTTISGLLNGQIYYIKVFVRKGTYWSTGVSINATPNFALNHFQSATSGDWNDYTTWDVWNGTSFVAATAGQFPNSNIYDVTIKNGHTVTLNAGGMSARTLKVDTTGKLYTNQSQNSTLRYIAIYSSIVCHGTIGDGTNDDGISFRMEGATCTISGWVGGTFYCARMKKESYPTITTNLTISRNINLTWGATALLNDCSATSTFNVIISAGATVSTRSDKGNVSIDGTNGADTNPLRGTITVYGTLNVNGKLYLTTNNTSGNPVNFTIRAGGIVNVDTVIASASGAGTHNLLIYNNGLLNVYGSAGFYNFSSTNNTYTCNGGAIGATIEYSGLAQPVESTITYTNLKYSGSGNKTANGNLTVNGNFTVDAAICEFNTSVKTLNIGGNLTLQNGGTMNDNCKTFLNITTSSATTAQTFTGNSQIIKCLNLTSVKTSGSLSLTGASGNTDLYIKNDLKIDHSGTAVLTDNGNTFNIGDDAEIGGTSSTSTNFNLTGTLKFFCLYSSTDIHLSDYAVTGVTKAHIGNLTIEPLTSSPINTVQFYPAGGTQTVFINGNLNILNTNATSTILNPNNNTISIKGDWTNYNATGFTEGTARVIFSGTASAQSIAASEVFNELEINNSNGVTLNLYSFVLSELMLTNGKLNTGANQISVLNNSVGSVSGYSTSSWVNGNLNRAVASTGNYDFPVGDATNYQLATVNLISSTGMSSILAFFNTAITGTPPNYPTTKINGDGIYGVLNSGFWTITPNAYLAVNYDITLNQRGYSNFSGNANQLGVIKRVDASADWLGTNLANSNGHHDNATQSIPFGAGVLAIAKRTGVTAFSDFAEGYGAVPLPVTLSAFNLNVKNNKLIELNWKTEAELNCDFYSVERSEDGINFTSIGKVNGHQTSDQPHNYQLTDYNPVCDESYYRLLQVDLNAEEHFSNMLSAIISCDGIIISPNLVLDILTLKFLKPNQGSTKIIISNIEGKLFVEKTIFAAESIVDLNVATLPAGLYLIQITNGSINYNSRFMKQ